MSKEFQWTDELVKEYAARLIVGNSDGVTYADEHLLHFKQSKTPKKDDKVADMVIGVIIKGNVVDYSNNASFGVKDGKVFVISMDGQVFVPETPEPKPEQPFPYFKPANQNFDKYGAPEQPKKERIVITQYSNINIPEEKFPAIKAAIERVLNDEEDDLDIFTKAFPREQLEKMTQHYNSVEKIVRQAEEKAFNAARLYHGLAGPKFDTFEDYLKSK